MKEDAKNKERRSSLRESLPAPLNQIALRHVHTVQSLVGNRKAILAKTLFKVGMAQVAACLATVKSSGDIIKTESDLICTLHQSEIAIETNSQDNNVEAPHDVHRIEEIDADYLVSLLIKCYPDMPQKSADLLSPKLWRRRYELCEPLGSRCRLQDRISLSPPFIYCSRRSYMK